MDGLSELLFLVELITFVLFLLRLFLVINPLFLLFRQFRVFFLLTLLFHLLHHLLLLLFHLGIALFSLLLILLLGLRECTEVDACQHLEHLHPSWILANKLHDHVGLLLAHVELVTEHDVFLEPLGNHRVRLCCRKSAETQWVLFLITEALHEHISKRHLALREASVLG